MKPNAVGRDPWTAPSPTPSFTAALIGETSLAIRCAEILLGKGHPICSVVSQDPQLVRWARTREIPDAPASADVADFLSRRPFDYLFVIICHSLLDNEILGLPRQLAINYHDGPLPRYAGVNATSWAILNREACHGVTWHCMSERVDAGPILVQHAVAVAPHDTALTLNLKCYEAGVEAFRELVDALAEGTLQPRPQDLGLRTYFRRSKRPPAACLLDWTRSVEELSALVRALSFGDYPNSLGTPKAVIGGDLVAVGQLQVLRGSGLPAGTVTGIDETSITIAVADADVALRGLSTLDGQPLSIGELAERHRLARGSRLPLLDAATATALGELHARLAPHEAFWIEQLTGVEPLTLPYRRPTHSDGARTYTRTTCEVPPHVRKSLRSLAGGAGEADVLLAAATVYLARLTGRRSFHIGLSRDPLTGCLAPFDSLLAQSLPLHVEIDPEDRFERTCEVIGGRLRVAREHRGHLRDLRQREPRIREQTRAFPIVLGVGSGEEDPPPGTHLVISVPADGARLVWTHRADVLGEEDVARMRRQLTTFLANLTARPDRPVGELELLSEAERRRLLVEWNDTASDFASDRCVHELFEEQADRTPDATALVVDDQSLRCQELDTRATQLAHHLRTLGVVPEVLVGICMERSLELVVGLLAILKAGGAYVPLDPDHPAELLACILEDSGAPVLLTQSDLLHRLPDRHAAAVVCLDTEAPVIAAQPTTRVEAGVGADNLAYVLYTSGPTGTPHGICVPHVAVVRRVVNGDYIPLTPADAVAQASDVTFDAVTFEVWGALLSGARLVIIGKEAVRSPGVLSAELRRRDITTLVITTARFNQIAAEIPHAFSGLRHLVVGGEKVDPTAVRRVLDAGRPSRLLHVYGPTEATTFATCYAIEDVGADATIVPIGRPMANTEVYLLDGGLQPVPVGVPGEVYIGGAGLARGYHNRPELTAERFIPHPFRADPGLRLYRTGDVARFRMDENIEFLGRLDECGEVEAVLGRHPGVSEVVVARRSHGEAAESRLVAYVVPSGGQAPGVAELRDHVRRRLPEDMVPSAFVVLEWLPLTPDGEVDRRALPAIEPERPGSAAYVAPRTEAEAQLAEIWAQVLRLERVGVEDNFFELGGDSIQCILIVTRAGQAGLRMSPWQVFEHQTVARLAAVAEAVPDVVAEQQAVVGEVPLTPIQHWFCEQQVAGWHHFNQSAWVEMPSGVDRLTLRGALAAVVAHHDALRLRLERTPGGWRQHIVATEEVDRLWWVNLSPVDAAERRSVIEAHAARLQASFDLEAGPLLRAVLFTGAVDEQSWLLIAVHHMAVDGVSWQILLEDLHSAYEQLRAGQEVRLPAKTTSYREWARRLHEYARSAALAGEAPYWLDERRREAVRLPVDHAGAENIVCSSAQVWMSLDEEETRRLLQEVPSAYRTQINDALLAALAQALSRWTGGGPLLVDLEGHGREELFEGVDLARTVGWFTTIAPLLLEVEDERADPGRWLRSVKEQLRRTPRKGIGFGLLRYMRGDPEVVERLMEQPCAEVSLNYLGQFGGRSGWMPLGTRGLPTGPQRSGMGRRAHLVEIEAAVEDGRLRACWTYSRAVHEERTVKELAEGFTEALRELIAHCCSPEAGGLTPSDVALAGLDQAMLDRLLG